MRGSGGTLLDPATTVVGGLSITRPSLVADECYAALVDKGGEDFY